MSTSPTIDATPPLITIHVRITLARLQNAYKLIELLENYHIKANLIGSCTPYPYIEGYATFACDLSHPDLENKLWAAILKIEPTGAELQFRLWELPTEPSHECTRSPSALTTYPAIEVLVEKIDPAKEGAVREALESVGIRLNISPYPSKKRHRALRGIGLVPRDFLDRFGQNGPGDRAYHPWPNWPSHELQSRLGALSDQLYDTLCQTNGTEINLTVCIWDREPLGAPDQRISRVGNPD